MEGLVGDDGAGKRLAGDHDVVQMCWSCVGRQRDAADQEFGLGRQDEVAMTAGRRAMVRRNQESR